MFVTNYGRIRSRRRTGRAIIAPAAKLPDHVAGVNPVVPQDTIHTWACWK